LFQICDETEIKEIKEFFDQILRTITVGGIGKDRLQKTKCSTCLFVFKFYVYKDGIGKYKLKL